MINPFKTKNAIIVRSDCLYKIKAPFFGDIEVTIVDFPHIKGQKVVVKVADESNSPKLFNDIKKDKEIYECVSCRARHDGWVKECICCLSRMKKVEDKKCK